MKLSSLDEDLHAKTWEALQNTDLDMRESLGIDKPLQTMQGELANNALKITEINESIKEQKVNRSWRWSYLFWKTKPVV